MEAQRFDAAVIALSQIGRRGVLAGVTAAVATLRGGFQVEAACKTTNKKCSAKAQCCSGKCKGGFGDLPSLKLLQTGTIGCC